MVKNKFIIIFVLYIISLFLFSCKTENINKVKIINNENCIVYDFSLKGDEYIIVPKNQTKGQSLSIIIKDKNDDLIVFDGGRIEDAEILTSIINDFGGKVKSWYITHIHDDHIGALYKILQDKSVDIEMLYYDFLDFDWYYEKIGDEAGIVLLFYEELKEYSKVKNIKIINSFHNIDKYNAFYVKILNKAYKLDSDSINNSSIVYKIFWKDISMIILGDLGYEGGEKLITDCSQNILKSDIVVMSHHGQNGVDKNVYQKISPLIAIWPTSKDIYENNNSKYKTNNTKKWLKDIGVKYNILSYDNTSIIK